ncbi:hypothetical protein [Gorillibacterium sp. sgz5001074]|uniref:hypothetical protein n=1 Tax=Gorillibacterium sp. sgz5001074 TaxID=3446695 RepID=UPI003F668DC6
MRLQDALLNWLQIHLVAEARPEDQAAKETVRFFEVILREDHHLSDFQVDAEDETMLHVRYTLDGKTKRQMFDKETAGQLLADINADIRYH